jgi:hypothetical protein
MFFKHFEYPYRLFAAMSAFHLNNILLVRKEKNKNKMKETLITRKYTQVEVTPFRVTFLGTKAY